MSYYLVGDKITEEPGGYGPIDLEDLRDYLRTKAEHAMTQAIRDEYNDFVLHPSVERPWRKDRPSVSFMLMFPHTALKAIAFYMCGDKYSFDIYERTWGEFTIDIKESE